MSAAEHELNGVPGAYGVLIDRQDGTEVATIYPEGVDDHKLVTHWISSDTTIPEGEWR